MFKISLWDLKSGKGVPYHEFYSTLHKLVSQEKVKKRVRLGKVLKNYFGEGQIITVQTEYLKVSTDNILELTSNIHKVSRQKKTIKTIIFLY